MRNCAIVLLLLLLCACQGPKNAGPSAGISGSPGFSGPSGARPDSAASCGGDLATSGPALPGVPAAMASQDVQEKGVHGYTAQASQVLAMRYPLIFGQATAKNTVIVYYNLQCPPARKLWPELAKFIEGQDPRETKVVFQGKGFDDTGTSTMLLAAAFAEQDPSMARNYITAVIVNGSAPFADPGTWAGEWSRKEVDAGRGKTGFDITRLVAVGTQGAGAYFEGLDSIARAYATTGTPTLVINGQVYTGERTAYALQAFLEASAPHSTIP